MKSKSPLPGMDPWLEAHWGDVHSSLTAYARDQMQSNLPTGLRARVEEYVSVESKFDEDDWRHHYVPDVAVVQSHRASAPAEVGGLVTAVETEPILLPRIVEPPTLRRIEILDTRQGNRLITLIEFLSPANKLGRGRQLFQAKQQLMIEGGVNVVEIDLVRTGDWTLSIEMEQVPVSRRGLYRAAVVRATRPEQCEYYPISYATPLPKIRVPLRPQDDDVLLQLQPLLDLAYANGAYAEEIDYSQSPTPPLSSADAKRIEQLREA